MMLSASKHKQVCGVCYGAGDGKRVVQEWTTTDWVEGYGPSRLELTFKEVPRGTEISMVHSNVPKEQADEIAEGWVEFYWNPLKEYFSSQSKT
jgi:activator of HSP90 ATPase